MTKASSKVPGKLLTLLLIVLAIAVLGTAPAAAAGRSYDEAPMQVQTKGLRAEQHLQRQAELSGRLARELPQAALEQAVRVSLTRDEITAVEQSRASPSQDRCRQASGDGDRDRRRPGPPDGGWRARVGRDGEG